jgi:hypothetical protein
MERCALALPFEVNAVSRLKSEGSLPLDLPALFPEGVRCVLLTPS